MEREEERKTVKLFAMLEAALIRSEGNKLKEVFAIIETNERAAPGKL